MQYSQGPGTWSSTSTTTRNAQARSAVVPKPTTTVSQPKVTQAQPVATPTYNYESGGGGGGSVQDWISMIQGMMPQRSAIQMPSLPAEPVVTQSMIAEWQKRAKEEAGMTYDPQILAIQQELDKAVLAAQQTKAGIAPSYQAILDEITKWQEETTKAEQQRAYARGFGQGGGLLQTETDIAKEALKQNTTALTEKARKETDIDAQVQLLKEQAGGKVTSAESAKASYITTRAADLQDSYKQQKAQLDQQRFANQMAIAEFGLTQESQDFNNWLSSMSVALDVWYKDQSLSLDRMAQELSAQANADALNWDKTKYYDSQARSAASGSGSTTNSGNMPTIGTSTAGGGSNVGSVGVDATYPIFMYGNTGGQWVNTDKKTWEEWLNAQNQATIGR